MKSIISIVFVLLFSFSAYSADLTATATASDFGKKNGKIALAITGGFAPYTINWTGPSGYISSKLNPDSLAPGIYCVTVTDKYCGTANLCITITEKTNTSIEELSQTKQLDIYPNPFAGELNIDFNKEIKGDIVLKLYDVLGRLVAEQKTTGQQKINWKLNGKILSGSYILNVQIDNKELLHRKLISIGNE
jgi:hypothetical protein